jgi:hypothetical protein
VINGEVAVTVIWTTPAVLPLTVKFEFATPPADRLMMTGLKLPLPLVELRLTSPLKPFTLVRVRVV